MLCLGTDHAGIATRTWWNAPRQGRQDPPRPGREAFVERVWQWKEDVTETASSQPDPYAWRFCGLDPRNASIMTRVRPRPSAAAVELHKEGYICWACVHHHWCSCRHTALADDEVGSHARKGQYLYHVRYDFEDGSGFGD